ncbi:MAG: hypothetical protein L3J70_10865 [Gammaproteobacteria bacterium]|nr:hypothetical protein [Gammaproteobacteria bacterium]
MKPYLVGILVVFLLQACSKSYEVDISETECNSLGGTLKGGDCILDMHEEDMKKICVSQNMEYSSEHNGCLSGEAETRKMCGEQGMQYSKEYNACIK